MPKKAPPRKGPSMDSTPESQARRRCIQKRLRQRHFPRSRKFPRSEKALKQEQAAMQQWIETNRV